MSVVTSVIDATHLGPLVESKLQLSHTLGRTRDAEYALNVRLVFEIGTAAPDNDGDLAPYVQ